MNKQEKYQGTLLGCAIGDTLGMPVEVWKREQIKKYWGRIVEPVEPKIIYDSNSKEVVEDEFGRLKYWFRGLSKGDYTDDQIEHIRQSLYQMADLFITEYINSKRVSGSPTTFGSPRHEGTKTFGDDNKIS